MVLVEYSIVGNAVLGGTGMKPALLRMYRSYIREVGLMRFEAPCQTVYAAPGLGRLLRQQKAMGLLRHLEVTLPPAPLATLRGVRVMTVNHHPLRDFTSVWQGEERAGRIELIRRLGATVGMVHSLKHLGTGDIINPNLKPIARHLAGIIRKSQVAMALENRALAKRHSGLIQDVVKLWGNSGGTLSGNWLGFPPVKVSENGLVIMDLSRANYSEPLVDLVSIRPQDIGLEDVGFFWEHFLQGYCATCELPAQWKEKIDVLYKIRVLQAFSISENSDVGDLQFKWWEKL